MKEIIDFIKDIAKLSDDTHTKVGACVVHDGKVVSTGSNKYPEKCNFDFPTGREGSAGESKYAFMVHAEQNAIVNCRSTYGSTLYTTLFPCSTCAKLIIQSGIKEVVYLDDKYSYTDDSWCSRLLFKSAGIKTLQYEE